MADWSASTRAATGILAANAILNASLAAIDIAAIADRTIGAMSWSGVIAHIVLLGGFLLASARRRQPQRSSPGAP